MPRTVLTSPTTIYCAPGGNDSNPGTAALPVLNVQAAVSIAYNEYDWQGMQPTIDISVNQTQQCSQSGPLVGAGQIVYNFSAPNLVWTSPGHCFDIAEKGISVLTGYPLTLVPDYPNAAGGKSAFYLHNDPTIDIFNGQNLVSGQAAGDTVIEADGPAIITVQSGFLFEGLLQSAFIAHRNSNWTISGEINFNGANVKLYDFRSGSSLNLNATYGAANGSVFTQSTVTGNAVVNSNGTKASIPGGITATAGGQINDSGSI